MKNLGELDAEDHAFIAMEAVNSAETGASELVVGRESRVELDSGMVGGEPVSEGELIVGSMVAGESHAVWENSKQSYMQE